MQLIRQLAHKAQAHGFDRDGAGYLELLVFTEPECLVGHIDVHHFSQHFSCIGAGQVDDAHGIGEVHHGKIPVVIPGVIADPFHGLAGPAGGGGEIVVVFPQFDHHTVINDTSVLITHGRILYPALLDFGQI